MSGLHSKNIELLPKTNRKTDNLKLVFNYIETCPIIDIKNTAKKLGISFNTASAAVKKLVALDILTETTNASRNKVFAYTDYLDILKKDM